MPFGQFDYEFDVPLFVNGSKEAGQVSGEAEIKYQPDGTWQIEAIYLTAWNTELRKFHGAIKVSPGTEIYNRIIMHLEGPLRKSIGYYVQDQIEEDRADGWRDWPAELDRVYAVEG